MSEPLYDITDDVKRQVLDATDLVSLIGATTSLKKTGASWKGLCPFHGEKTPSFHVHPQRGFYYCFGCGAKGDAITFVREAERLEFPEAVAYLARLANITLPQRKRTGTRAERGRDLRTTEALLAAAAFFRDTLKTHREALRVLTARHIEPAEAGLFGFGAAPDSWDALKAALSPVFPEEVLLEAGLLQKHPDTGRVYDRFRNRLMIEIKDARGELLGFGARALLPDDQPKYLNSPESARFTKGKLLYGLDRAKETIRKTNEVVLCEGYFDRIAFEKAGLGNAVASMGTALTTNQAELLSRQAATVVVAYDGDRAGQAASWKAFGLLLGKGAAVRHLALPEGLDPDSFLEQRGPEALRAEVENAPPLLPAILRGLPAAGSDPTARAAAITEAAGILRQAVDPVLRFELLSGLARGAGVPGAVVGLEEGKKRPRPRVVETGGAERLPETEEKVLRILVEEWPASADITRSLPVELFSHPNARDIFSAIKGLADSPGATLDFSSLESHLEGGGGHVLARLLLQASQESEDPGIPVYGTGGSSGGGPASGPGSEGEFIGSTGKAGPVRGLGRLHRPLLHLRIRQLETNREALQSLLVAAGAARDGTALSRMYVEKQKLSAEITKLQADLRRHE